MFCARKKEISNQAKSWAFHANSCYRRKVVIFFIDGGSVRKGRLKEKGVMEMYLVAVFWTLWMESDNLWASGLEVFKGL